MIPIGSSTADRRFFFDEGLKEGFETGRDSAMLATLPPSFTAEWSDSPPPAPTAAATAPPPVPAGDGPEGCWRSGANGGGILHQLQVIGGDGKLV